MSMPPSAIQVTLQIAGGDRSVSAKLQFRNSSSKKAFLYKVAACPDGKIKNNVFVIEATSGKVPYIGRYYRRAAPKLPDDYIELAPGASFNTQIRLGEVYEFPPGPGSYRAHFEAIDPSRTEGGDLREMRSPEVVFQLPG